MEAVILRGQGRPIVKYRDTLQSPVQKRLNHDAIVMPFGLWAQNSPRNHELDGVQIPHKKGQFWGKGSSIVKYRDFLPWAVHKLPNWSICRLGCGLGWAEGSTSSIVFARRRQCARMAGHMPWLFQITSKLFSELSTTQFLLMIFKIWLTFTWQGH